MCVFVRRIDDDDDNEYGEVDLFWFNYTVAAVHANGCGWIWAKG